jgi:hypothetical protein
VDCKWFGKELTKIARGCNRERNGLNFKRVTPRRALCVSCENKIQQDISVPTFDETVLFIQIAAVENDVIPFVNGQNDRFHCS